MASSQVKRESHFVRFRKRWRRRGVMEISESHPKHQFTMFVRQGLKDSIAQGNGSGDPGGNEYSEQIRRKLTSEDNKTKFEFVTFAPRVFYSLREQVGMPPEMYSECICPDSRDTKYLEFVSNSKSGQNFFLSNNKQLMIKTHSTTENNFFLKILPRYVEHLKAYPHTLLVRYLGLHKITVDRQYPVYFTVMQSILFPDERIDIRFDLKACQAGRFVEEESEPSGMITVLKDVNFDSRKIHLGCQSSWFQAQINHDTDFLCGLRVLDYSLLIGVQTLHPDEVRGNMELASIVLRTKRSVRKNVGAQRPAQTEELPPVDETQESFHLPGAVDSVESSPHSSSHKQGTYEQRSEESITPTQNSATESESVTQNRRLLPQCRNELHAIDGPNHERYFVGIIDFFTTFGLKKRCESLYKAVKYKTSGKSYSTVNPDSYAKRFQEFLSNHVV